MESRTLEITLISGKDLNKVNLISKMDVYAVVSIEGGAAAHQKTRTPVVNGGDTSPAWNFTMKFTVDEALARQNRLTVVFKIRCERALGDKDIGEVQIPVRELLDSPGGAEKPQFVSYQVRKPSGKPKGQLNLSYKFGGKISAPGPAHAPPHEAVVAYPAPPGSGAPYPPQHAYPPPKDGGSSFSYPQPLKEGESSSAYPPPAAGYPPHGAPATAYPAQAPAGYGYGYAPPPPQGYGGYAPPPQGYAGYPPAGYPPQGGPYGYAQPPMMQQAKPPKKNRMGMGLGAGLLGGALGGLLIGDMISDAGDYGGGFDDGGFDGGFDF